MMYCIGECSDEDGREKWQGGVELVVRAPITRAASPPEIIHDRMLKVTL